MEGHKGATLPVGTDLSESWRSGIRAENCERLPAAEVVEGRPATKEDTMVPNTCLIQIRESVSQGQCVRTVCSGSCKYGSVRGVAGNGHPYRDGSGSERINYRKLNFFIL